MTPSSHPTLKVMLYEWRGARSGKSLECITIGTCSSGALVSTKDGATLVFYYLLVRSSLCMCKLRKDGETN